MKPITSIIKEKGGATTYPTNQEVTLNPDGTGGPVLMSSASNDLEEVAEQLEGAVEAHGNQAKVVRKHIKKMESPNKLASPTKKKDACYAKVKSRYKKWPSAYASGALVKCRKVGAANWGNKSK